MHNTEGELEILKRASDKLPIIRSPSATRWKHFPRFLDFLDFSTGPKGL